MDDSDFCSSDESSPYEENDDRRIVKYRKSDIKDVNIRDSVLASFGHLLKAKDIRNRDICYGIKIRNEYYLTSKYYVTTIVLVIIFMCFYSHAILG